MSTRIASNFQVKAVVPPHQLLVFNVKEGWEPLCKFLDCPVPTIPFPNINDRREILMVFNILRAVSWITVLGLPLLMYKMFSFCENLLHLAALIILGIVLFWGVGEFCKRVVKKQTDKSKMQWSSPVSNEVIRNTFSYISFILLNHHVEDAYVFCDIFTLPKNSWCY